MTFRVLLLVVGAACTAALPARAQKRGSFEIGVFAAYLNADVFAGIGFVRNTYTGTYKAKDSGAGGLVGVRGRFGKMVAIRLDGHADFIPSSANHSYLVSYNGNWGIGIGVSALLNR